METTDETPDPLQPYDYEELACPVAYTQAHILRDPTQEQASETEGTNP